MQVSCPACCKSLLLAYKYQTILSHHFLILGLSDTFVAFDKGKAISLFIFGLSIQTFK
jgi:hypothetical protein